MKRLGWLVVAAVACVSCSRVVSHSREASSDAGDEASADASADLPPPPGKTDTADAALGERLFLETRFAQFFFQSLSQNPTPADYNRALVRGDPVLDEQASIFESFPGPFAGKSMNCRSCHLVDDLQQLPAPNGRHYSDYFKAGVRNYSDFARRSPIPLRSDGATVTPRNSPTLVNSTVARDVPFFLHFDGEFATSADLVRATYTGRNFGWLPDEAATAVAHFAAVIRNDDGTSDIAQSFSGGLPYSVILAGTDPRIPSSARVSPQLRLDVTNPSVTDAQVLDAAIAFVVAYLDSLRFKTDAAGAFSASPYDVFLRKNGLPAQPNPGESPLAYARRLRSAIDVLGNPQWVTDADGSFEIQAQAFQFSRKQLDGMKLFFSEPASPAPSGRVGNCIACHAPPQFTDFSFHNVGAAQDEYDSVFGAGAFAALAIPSLTERSRTPDLFLPASAARPGGQGPFKSAIDAAAPGRTDLGVWNVFANDAIPGPQPGLRALLEAQDPPSDDDLARTVALFKTPTVRDLGQSAPYFHTGQYEALEGVLQHYVDFSALARAGNVRNAAPELADMTIKSSDIEALRAFLRSLEEDYH